MKAVLRFLISFLLPCEANNWRPKILESGLLLLVVGALILLKFADVTFLLYLPKSAFFADVTKSQLLDLTNQERQRLGLFPLTSDPTLEKAAYFKGQDMLEKGYFSHNSPSGVNPWYWFKAAGYSYRYAGENLAIGFVDSQELFNAWDNSSSHRENLLNPNYKEIGIAVLRGNFDGAETYVVVQLFGTPKSQLAVQKTVQTAAKPPAAQPALTQQLNGQGTTKIEGESSFPPEVDSPKAGKTQDDLSTKSSQAQKENETISPIPAPHVPNSKLVAFPFTKFLTQDYSPMVEKTIAFFVIFLVALLFMSIFVRFEIQHKDLLSRTIGIIVFMTILLSMDKNTILQIMPHNLLI